MTDKFKNKRIAVLGGGIEGVSSKKWLKKHGSLVTVLDQKYNKDYLKNLDEYDLIVRSPGTNINKIQNSEFRILL